MASQWPPRSPHEALLGTPSGRERLRRLAERQSPSPSPSKLRTARSTSELGAKFGGNLGGQPDDDDGEDEDDDEETLQLKLQAIEARLKLKKLKAAKAQKRAAASSLDPGAGNGQRPVSAPGDAAEMRELPIQSKIAAARDRMEGMPPKSGVQVPASPVRRTQSAANATSPQRIVLGIDKGLRATDVSLKRVPGPRKTPSILEAEEPRPMSFNERLASARGEEASRQEMLQRIQKARSKAFSIGKDEMEEFKSKALDIPEEPYMPQQFSRNDVLSSLEVAAGDPQQQSTTAPPTTGSTEISEASFESYSGLHLSKRILPHKVVARAITGKKSYVLKDLLRHVKAPEWCLPDVESDIVVFAIIASKSDPRSHRPGPGGEGKPQEDRGKYMVVTLVDLTYEVELFLFNTGFERFWKLTPGTVLAILNPNIMPPPPGRGATGRFGLVINSDEDTILEIGKARDLGYCKSVKRDGRVCSSWINARRSEYCEFHTNEAVGKSRSSRMELNSTTSFGSGGSKGGKNARRVWQKSEEEKKRANYDRATQSTFFVSNATRGIDLLDEEGGMADRTEREEALKRKLVRQEKERDIAKKLGQMGGGAGKEYMSRSAHPHVNRQQLPRHAQPKPMGRSCAGPRRKRPESSASNSTSNSTSGGAGDGRTSGGNKGAAFGWGSSLRNKLTRMKDGERLDGREVPSLASGQPSRAAALAVVTADSASSGSMFVPLHTARSGSRSPVRKKTRFVTEKGIREAGRESLGEPLSAAMKNSRQVVLDDDDDDDLIIVK
ncbi:hypothetical protein B0H67DRAFT_602802 [Lasiosphaeris hirsuta]|uniref:Zinc finger Mcm10/DnaG-type domain-containing protein n=1 Tax=Lasiosphaeris hirsuta TaxID=260670 RepID=A0AA40A1D4_9PEZI|nr:hypothetical protein B0H67DRAFT_602802 [Lasiosphaeris hirsuta]